MMFRDKLATMSEVNALRENQREADRRLTALAGRVTNLEESTPFKPFPRPILKSPRFPDGLERRLDNGSVWEDAAGVHRTISTMDVDHVENCLRMLRGQYGHLIPMLEQTPVMKAFKARIANEALRLNAVVRDR